jgi:hypothetical protein
MAMIWSRREPEQILLAALSPLAWSHRKFPAPSARAEKNHGVRFEGIRKSNLQGNRPANRKTGNSITSTRPIAQPNQRLLNFSRTTK